MEKKRYYNIDFLRFIFAIMIVYYHMLPQINSFSSTPLLADLANKVGQTGPNIVNAFFILSGFFLLQSFDKNPQQDTYKFAINKFIRLWPVMAFSFLIVLIFGNFDKYNDILNVFFINSGLGLTLKSSANAASWFICVLFFLSIFFHYLMKTFSRKNLIFICSIFTFWGFSILAHAKTGLYSAIILPVFCLTAGMIRGLACISLGIICADIWEKIENIKIKNTILNSIILGGIECLLLWYFIQYSAFHVRKFNIDTYWQLIFIGIFFLFLLNKGFLSKFLNNKLSKILGDFSYSIFVMHFPIITICKKYFWNNFAPEISAILTFSICIIAGILTHILIEKNINKIIKNWRNSRERERERVIAPRNLDFSLSKLFSGSVLLKFA